MGQYWKIVNIDKAQQLRNQHGVKLLELLGNGQPEQLVDLLKVPQLRGYKFGDGVIASARERSVSSRLISLPQELRNVVVAFVAHGVHIISLALTCSYFFRLLAPAARRAIIGDEAPWANNRLVTVGDHACCISADEVLAIMAGGPDEWYVPNKEHDPDEPGLFKSNPFYYMKAEYVTDTLASQDNGEHQVRSSIFGEAPATGIRRLRDLRLNASNLGLLERLYIPDSDVSHPAVLRCPELKQYVKDAVIASWECAYSLGEVLCCYTQWTEDGRVGQWAGLRFDIATARDVDESWTDVSESVVEYLADTGLDLRADDKRA